MARNMLSLVALALLAPLALAACATSSHTDYQVLGLEAADVTPFIDIPVPLAFKICYDPLYFIRYKSYRLPRAGYMHYTGGSDLLAVQRFYQDFLPPEGWKFIKGSVDSGSTYFYYSKPDETLIVNVFAVKDATEVILKLIPGSAFGPAGPNNSSGAAISSNP